jgi:hypothetical protein
MSKKRAPIEQLKEAGRQAIKMLAKKGITTEASILDAILLDKTSPPIPGIPAYLPHQNTLKTAERIMFNLILLWREECTKHPEFAIVKEDTKGNREDNITEFFRFISQEMQEVEKAFESDMNQMSVLMKGLNGVPVIKDVFGPMRNLENAKAIHRFFIDSFAIAIVLKSNDTTADYANWFIEWTQDLYALWVTPDKRDKIERV